MTTPYASEDVAFSLLRTEQNPTLPFRPQRLKCFMVALCLGFILLGGRLVWITLWEPSFSIGGPKSSLLDAPPLRGELTDRTGTLLAINIPTFAVYAHPLKIHNKEEVLRCLGEILPTVSIAKIRKALYSSKPFVWIARHITTSMRLKIQALGVQGIGIQKTHKRLYPYDSLFAHVIGMTDVDQNGVAGLEKSLQARLMGAQHPLRLSLDARIQHIIHTALTNQISRFHAIGGNSVLVHIPTGEIIAMVSIPDFSPKNMANVPPQALFNRNVSGVYEFGSILKIHNTALFLEHGKGGLAAIFDASKPLVVGKHVIRDFKGKGCSLTVKEAFIYSSDIAHARMALSVGGKAQVAFFKKMGFSEPIKTELPECARPLFPQSVSVLQTAVRSFGYGIAITPLHLVQSLRNLLGYTSPLTFLLWETQPTNPRKSPVKPETSLGILTVLGAAVTEGRVSKAAASNCPVGAKTGTANVLVDGRYLKDSGCNFTSCISVFPIDNPQYILLVSLDRAKGDASTYGYSTAGWIAAPLAAFIVESIVPLLGILQAPIAPAFQEIEDDIDSFITHLPGVIQ